MAISDFDLTNIPSEVLQQYILENQDQIYGEGPPVIGAYNPATGAPAISTSTTSNTSVINEGTQRVINNTQVSSTIFTSTFYLPFNPNRVWLAIQNQSGAPLYVSFSGQGAPFTTGFLIPPNNYWEPYSAPKNSITVSGGSGVVMEGVL